MMRQLCHESQWGSHIYQSIAPATTRAATAHQELLEIRVARLRARESLDVGFAPLSAFCCERGYWRKKL